MALPDEDRRALGQTRRLVFQNVANNVPPERVGQVLFLSALEVEQALAFVGRKITEYLVLRRQAPIPCHDLRMIRLHRRELLAALSKIGDLDLSSDLLLAKVTIQNIDHPEMIQGMQHQMAKAYGR